MLDVGARNWGRYRRMRVAGPMRSHDPSSLTPVTDLYLPTGMFTASMQPGLKRRVSRRFQALTHTQKNIVL